MFRTTLPLIAVTTITSLSFAAEPEPSRGDAMISEYLRIRSRELTDNCFADVRTADDWLRQREQRRRELFEMLGLDPQPDRTPLNPVVTGTVEHDEFTVENIHFQSRPGLYVTGNFYLPKQRSKRLPAILYVCGHGRVKKDGVSFGNKVHYQHHGGWFARNGYACLTIDTLQLGEIEGIHHGTYRHGRWWWNSRGYTSAGVEAWNCIRALDYLQTRDEVDPDRIGVTGRSGGGAYSWWAAALDDRVKAAVPVAGITSLHNHVVDGCVEGHCDCMYPVNTYQWDFPMVAALVAPRPLLISNSDKDRIFPLDGVVDVHRRTRRIYELLGASDKLGLQITEGPHKDTQELRVHAFHWFNRFLKEEEPLIETTAVKFFEPQQLKVFQELPSDELNTTIDESFTAQGTDWTIPASTAEWESMSGDAVGKLESKCFRGWPEQPGALDAKPAFDTEASGIRFAGWDFTSEHNVRLRLYVAHRAGLKPQDLDLTVLNVLDEPAWHEFASTISVGFPDSFEQSEREASSGDPDDQAETIASSHSPESDFEQNRKMFESFQWGMAWLAPRGIGPTAWNAGERNRTHIRRRHVLLGQTVDGQRVWDVRRAVQSLRSIAGFEKTPLWLQSEREMAGVTLYASLFEPDIVRLDLHDLPQSHRIGPELLNVLRVLDVPQAVALAAARSKIRLYAHAADGWEYPQQVASRLEWPEKQIQIRVMKKSE